MGNCAPFFDEKSCRVPVNRSCKVYGNANCKVEIIRTICYNVKSD